MQHRVFRFIAIILILCISSPLMPNIIFEQNIGNTQLIQVMNRTTTSATIAHNMNRTTTSAAIELKINEGIYINGGAEDGNLGIAAGDDTADGLSIQTPVKTFARAKELVENVQRITGESIDIIVCGPIKLDGQKEIWSLNEGSELIRYGGYSKVMIEVRNNGELTLKNITINGNKENNVRAEESAVKIIRSTLIMEENAAIINNKNTSSVGGGLYLDYSNFIMKGNSKISGNEANDGGGIFQYASQTTMQGESRIENNKARDTGGGIRQNQSTVTLEDEASISNNQSNYGGGVFVSSGGNTFILKEAAHIENNKTNHNGGGVFVGDAGDLELSGGMIANNQAGISGGGICSRGTNTIENSVTIAENHAKYGGGIWFEKGSDSEIKGNVMIINNTATETAGGVGQNVGSQLLINESVMISGNNAYRAGGLYIAEDTTQDTVADCTVEGNVVIQNNKTTATGGGIWQTGGKLKIQDEVHITNNISGTSGGGISVKKGIAIIEGQVKVDKNQAQNNGGGIYLENGTLQLSGGSIQNNTAVNGGGFYFEDGYMEMQGGQIKQNIATSYGGGIYVKENIAQYPLLMEGDISDNADPLNSQITIGKGSSVGIGKGEITVEGILYLSENATIKVVKAITNLNALYEIQCVDEAVERIVVTPDGEVSDATPYRDYFKLVSDNQFILRKKDKNIVIDQKNIADKVCFIDELKGSDFNSGHSPNEAFKTLTKAYKYLRDTGGTIYTLNPITISDKVSISKEHYSVLYGLDIKVDGEVTLVGIDSEMDKEASYLFKVADQGKLTLQDIEIKADKQDLGLIQIDTNGDVMIKNNATLSYNIVDENLPAIDNEGSITFEGGKINNAQVTRQAKVIYQKGRFILAGDQGIDLGSDIVYLAKDNTIEMNKLWQGKPITIAFEAPQMGDEVIIFADGAISASESVWDQIKHFTVPEDILLVQGESQNDKQTLMIGRNPEIQEEPEDYFGMIGETAEFVVKYNEAIPVERMIMSLKDEHGQSVTCADIVISKKEHSIIIKMDITEETIGTYQFETNYMSATQKTSFTLSGYEISYASGRDRLIARASRSQEIHKDYAILRVKSGYEDDWDLTLKGHALKGITTNYKPQLVDDSDTLNIRNKDAFTLQIDRTESVQSDVKWTIILGNSDYLTNEAQGELLLEGLQIGTSHRSSETSVYIPFETKVITGVSVKLNKDNSWLEQDAITLIDETIGQQYYLEKDSEEKVYFIEGIPVGEYVIYRLGTSTRQAIKITEGNLEKVILDYYTLTLIHNDGTGESTVKEVLNGTAYGDVLLPMKRKGYHFAGYYTALEGGELYEGAMIYLTKPQTLYAQWVKKAENTVDKPIQDEDKSSQDEESTDSWEEIIKNENIQGALDVPTIKNQVPYYIRDKEKVVIGFSTLVGNEIHYIAPANVEIYFMKNQKYFSDITHHWGKEAIDFITEREVFLGMTEEVFEPDRNMTRAMVVTVMGRLYEKSYEPISLDDTKGFQDVDETAYYGKYISWAMEHNIVEGRTSEIFAPDEYITREEFAKILYRYAAQLGEDISINKEGLMGMKDQDEVSYWATESMTYCIENELIIGYNKQLRPRDFMTRAESAQILKRYIEMIVRHKVNVSS